MQKIILSVLLYTQVFLVAAQDNWQFTSHFNVGCNLTLNYRVSQQFPGLRMFAAYNINGINSNRLLLSYAPTISIYTKSLGANLNPLIGDIQMDLTNSFHIGYGWEDLPYTKYYRTINTGGYYNIATNKKYALMIGTNFIVNNNKRNQVVGSFSFSSPNVSINYYNDGAAPFNILPLADNFDRWWTGGFGAFLHSHSNYNILEFSFDQFTGYSPLLYELSNVIGINMPQYSLPDSTVSGRNSKIPPTYNASAYNIRYFPAAGFAIDAGVLGSLRTQSGRVFGLQDIIHVRGLYPLHPNSDINRYYIGGSYNNLQNVKL
ncbi:hypothetical protein [Aridibaculum aurantiacum]|uniref:hypothetical protein n=1 Tax=Aridibaculum aurantiacum TaxID=2810307 RepID=UPI001A97B0CD|nr:hypothetical protein [Aridibaculum aurantiacum]